jgi:dUTP pyrophosphatase
MGKIRVLFKKLHPDAQVPFRKHIGDAGYDLFSIEDKQLELNSVTPVRTGISLKMPEGYYSEVHTRSSQGIKGIKNHLGIIDEGYHGEITVLMFTRKGFKPNDNYVVIHKGDKIAQLIFKKRVEVDFLESNKDFESSRGIGGFGSTGR